MNGSKVVALAVVGIMIASSIIIFSFNPEDVPLSAKISTTSGDVWSGSHTANGDWYIYAPTVYDGETFQCPGNITIVSGGLTYKNGLLTINVSSQYEHVITVADGAYFTLSESTLRTSNSSTGVPWVKIIAASDGNIRISNSTVKHFKIEPYASNDWIDNSTLHASKIDCLVGGLYKSRINISYNSIDGLVSGQAISGGFPRNSNITGNTIEANCSQTYQAGGPGWINVLGPYVGQSRGTHVIKNQIKATVRYVGIYLTEANLINVSRNTIDKVARNSNGTYVPGICAGIFFRGEGYWSTIDNNTIKRITGDPTVGGYSGFNIGIAGFVDAIHWNIYYNKIWRIGSAENNSCLGIDYQGSHAEIKGNNISYVGLDQGPAYINTAGIIVENNGMDAGGVYDPGNYNLLNCEYVNTTYNVIDRVQQASNGIAYGWAQSATRNVTKGIIANNTIGTTYVGSGGIGVYIHVSHIQVLDNTITSVNHDSYGIGVATDAKYITVSRNDIHVVSLNLVNYGGDYYGEGVSNWSEAAIMMGSETYMDTLEGCIFSYNHIEVDDRSNGPGLLPYSDYIIHYCAEADPMPVFIITEPANFVFINSTLDLYVVTGINYRAHFDFPPEGSSNGSYTGSSYHWNYTGVQGYYIFLNVTFVELPYPVELIPLVNLIFTFLCLGVAIAPIMFVIKTTKEKKKLPTASDVIHMAVYIIISLVLISAAWIAVGT
jgi:hypothetical protein